MEGKDASETRSCWAAAASACEGALSKEHFFTRGIWQERLVTLTGFPFLNGSTRQLPVDAVTVRSLCRKHNSELSPVDQGAIDCANALREFQRLTEARQSASSKISKWTWLKYTVDGISLERWLFKTACSAAYVLPEEVGEWRPPNEMVRFAFGLESPPYGTGLAIIGDVNDQIEMKEEQMFAFLRESHTKQVGGCLAQFRGITLLGTWDRRCEDLLPLKMNGIQGRSAMWHPNEFNSRHRVAVRFDWTGNFKPARELVKLRKRYPGVPR